MNVLPPTAATESAGDDQCTGGEIGACGNEHSKAVHVWVRCKAAKGKDACAKPTPPGIALGRAKQAGKAPGPASADGRGHGWGRALAIGQHKPKTKSGDDDQAEDE
jgi:hypothetical protein